MKQFIYCFLICFYFISCGCDYCCPQNCGEHGICDEMDGRCRCEIGYTTVAPHNQCKGFSRNLFLGEWEAKDTLCGNDTCRQIPYTVRFLPHSTDAILFYAENLATQVCNNPDSAIWIVSAMDSNFVRFRHSYENFPTMIVSSKNEYNYFTINFRTTIDGHLYLWKTLLRRK